MPVAVDRPAALRDLQELKARSTTQFRDELRKQGMTDEAEQFDGNDLDIEADYEPSEAPEGFVPDDRSDDEQQPAAEDDVNRWHSWSRQSFVAATCR